MTRDEYKKYLRMLGEELQKQNVTGEILVTDDVMVMLDVSNPEDADEIDAYFNGHGELVKENATHIAERERLPASWLEELSQILFSQSPDEQWMEYPGLRIYSAAPDFILAIKVITGKQQDVQDIKKLANRLHVSQPADMLALIIKYVPLQLITTEMHLLIIQACV